jgi:hypothetical protein
MAGLDVYQLIQTACFLLVSAVALGRYFGQRETVVAATSDDVQEVREDVGKRVTVEMCGVLRTGCSAKLVDLAENATRVAHEARTLAQSQSLVLAGLSPKLDESLRRLDRIEKLVTNGTTHEG